MDHEPSTQLLQVLAEVAPELVEYVPATQFIQEEDASPDQVPGLHV